MYYQVHRFDFKGEINGFLLRSYYPWFETFYTILNDLSHIINSKSVRIVVY
jgi:hypothetical protein